LDYLVHDGALHVYERGGGLRDADGRLRDRSDPTYHLPFGGTTAPGAIRPATKDLFGRPYVPGSAIKGALHTALAAALLERERAAGRPAKKDELAPSARFAAQPLERRLFGAQPRISGLRALRLSDAQPADGTRLTLAAVRTYTVEAGALVPLSDRVAVEAIAPGGRLIGSLIVDESWLALQHPRLESAPNREILRDLLTFARDDGLQRAAVERAYVAGADARALVTLYDALLSAGRTNSDKLLLVQLGWGAGWGSKSFGAPLTASPDWPQIHAEYFSGRTERRRPPNQPRSANWGRGGPRPRSVSFPTTRKLTERRGAPALPLGWALVWLLEPDEPLPPRLDLPVEWHDDAFAAIEREPAVAAAPSGEPARPEPATPFAALHALLRPSQPAPAESVAAPPAPIARVADRQLKVGMILEAEVVAVEPTRLLVDVGRSDPATLDAATVGGGNLAARFSVGQRLRVRVLTPPPFFRIRLA
jgi:CRISPR type III-A-associated RAMP protein Csm5